MVIFEIYVCCQLNIAFCKLKLCLQASSLLLHAPSSSVAQRTTIVTPRYRSSSFVLIFSLFSLWDHNCDTKVSILFKFLFLHFLFFSAAAFLLRLPLHMVEYHPGTFSTLKPVRIILIIFINNQSAT